MTARKTKLILAGGALALMFALPAAYAQGTDTPPAPPATMTPPPADTTTPATTTPATTPDTTTPSSTATDTSQPKPKMRFRIGPEVGVYLPTSSKTRSEFGSTWLSFGLGLGNIDRISPKGQTAFDLQILYQSKNGNHAFVAPIGIGYRQAFGEGGPNTAYYGVAADLYLTDLKSQTYNVSGFQVGVGGSALLGVDFGDTAYLEARYMLVSKIHDFDLSGLDLTAGFRF